METLNKAIAFAVEKHENQRRKGTPWPYIVHIYDVVQSLSRTGADELCLIAGALHDTVEDTGTTIEEIVQNFGYEVAYVVNTLSEKKDLPYNERKHLQAQRIGRASVDVKLVKCADCLVNLRSTQLDLIKNPNIWAKFNAPKEDIQRHYLEMIEAISELQEFPIYEELKEVYASVFKTKDFNIECFNNSKLSGCGTPIESSKSKTKKESVAEQLIRYCTDCNHMKRELTPDPDDWFCDDEERYICGINNRVLSEANRPYEKQIAPKDCPIM